MYYYSKKLFKYPNLIAGGFFNQKTGPLQFLFNNSRKKMNEVRKKYFKKLKIDDPKNVVLQNQQHTTNIKIITKNNLSAGVFSPKTAILNNDGMITEEKNVFLGIFSADCVPVLLYDSKKQVCGAAHCGWKGTYNLLAAKMAKKFILQFKSKPENIICYLGPSIGKCCYEISKAKDGRAEKFLKKFGKNIVTKKKDKIYLDLKTALLQQLLNCGIKKKNVEISPICTCCHPAHLPSYYRGKKLKNSLLTVIGVKTQSTKYKTTT
jgi:YfiH family protein